MMKDNPIVFISYSHDSEEHKNWVKKLATLLRSHGIDVILDQWDLHIGQDLRFFMEHGVTKSKMVLCICSENYVYKANSGIGGTGYENMIISRDLLQNVNLDYIIPIIRNNATDQKTPVCLGTKLYIDFSDDTLFFENYRTLLERIYNEDVKKKPPLGSNPFADAVVDEIIAFDFSSHARKVYRNEIVIFKNEHGKFLAIKILSVDSRSHGKEKNVMTFEYKIIKENIEPNDMQS